MTLPGTWKSNYTLVDNGDSWALCFAEPSSSGDHVEILIIDTCSNEEEANEISGMLDNSRIMGGGNSEYWGFVVGTPTDAYDSSTYTEEQLNKLQQMRGDVNDVLGTFMSK